jgi:hypothetical protein
MTIDCKEGDDVQVRSSGGKAWIVGNQSAPPTDDSKAEEVEKKTEKFAERIKSVEKVAGDAEEVANAVNQKVWSDEAGLHIADGKQDAAAERNTIWNSLGMLFRKGLNPILGVLTGDNPRVAIYDGQGSTSEHEVAHFGATSSVGRNDDYNISIAPENFELNNGSNNGNATLFRVGASGNPTSEIYQKTEHLNYQEQTVLSDTPVSGSTITVKIIYLVGTFDFKSQTLTFTAGTSATKAWAKGNVKYTAPRTFEYSGSVFSIEATYSVQADAIDLGIMQFGSRQDGGVGNNSTTIGNELVAPYSYQTVVGKHNAPVDAPFIVGVGSPEENKNGVTIDWDGNVKTEGDIYVNCNADSSGTAHIGQVFNWQGSLKSNLTANAGSYVEGDGSIALKGGHVYLVLAYVAMTNSTNGTVDRRAQIFNKTANAAVLTGDKFVASQSWGTVETQTIYEANEDVTLTVRGSASRPTTTIPTAWIRAVCIA